MCEFTCWGRRPRRNSLKKTDSKTEVYHLGNMGAAQSFFMIASRRYRSEHAGASSAVRAGGPLRIGRHEEADRRLGQPGRPPSAVLLRPLFRPPARREGRGGGPVLAPHRCGLHGRSRGIRPAARQRHQQYEPRAGARAHRQRQGPAVRRRRAGGKLAVVAERAMAARCHHQRHGVRPAATDGVLQGRSPRQPQRHRQGQGPRADAIRRLGGLHPGEPRDGGEEGLGQDAVAQAGGRARKAHAGPAGAGRPGLSAEDAKGTGLRGGAQVRRRSGQESCSTSGRCR